MKLKISKREFQFFLLGILAMVLFTIAYEWKDFKAGFKGGFTIQTEVAK